MTSSSIGLTTTDDAFLGGRLSILQPSTGYRAGLDAVLLAASTSVPTETDSRLLDAGAGAGVVGLAIAAGAPRCRVTMVEVDPNMAGLARLNADRNGFGSRVTVVIADVARGGALLHDAGCPPDLKPGAFTHLVMNPPYYATGSGTAPAMPSRRTAHQMAAESLARWMAFLAAAAATDGRLTLVHRADALHEVLAALTGRFGRAHIRPVHPRDGAPASRISVSAIKGSRAPLTLLSGLVLQDAEGRYLPEIEGALRHGARLSLE